MQLSNQGAPADFIPASPVATALGLKIEAEEWAEVEQMLKDGGEEIIFALEDGSLETCLHIAARHATCWSSIIELIVAGGKGIEFQKDKSGWTPFHIAAYSDATNEVLDHLIAHTTDSRKGVAIANEAGELPLHIAAKGGAKHNVMSLTNVYGREGGERCEASDKTKPRKRGLYQK